MPLNLSRADIAAKLVLVCRRMAEKGFVTATDGNVSARLPNGNILITPSSVNKGEVGESMLVEVQPDGTPVTLNRAPSTELKMHTYVYHLRPDVQAIVHGHPTYATGFAVARVPLTEDVLPEVIIGLGNVPLAEYATPTTEELPDSLTPHVRTADAILLANHGVVAYGKSVEDAYYKLEKVEHAAHITFVARMLGGEYRLTPDQLKRLYAAGGYRPSAPHTSREEYRDLESDFSREEIKDMIRTMLADTKADRS